MESCRPDLLGLDHRWKEAPLHAFYTEQTVDGLSAVPVKMERCEGCGMLRVTDGQIEDAKKRMRFRSIITPPLPKKG